MSKAALDTRQQILSAALKRFAEQGYAGTSVQEIVDAAHVTKPTLYYYFRNKAGLYRALVDWAFEERYRLTQRAAARANTLAGQLTEICATAFAFIQRHRALTRLAFATMFAAPGEAPAEAQCIKRGFRNFEFIHGLIKKAMAKGELRGRFKSQELAMGFFGMMNLHVMACLVDPRHPLNRRTAQRVVQLFLAGAQSA